MMEIYSNDNNNYTTTDNNNIRKRKRSSEDDKCNDYKNNNNNNNNSNNMQVDDSENHKDFLYKYNIDFKGLSDATLNNSEYDDIDDYFDEIESAVYETVSGFNEPPTSETASNKRPPSDSNNIIQNKLQGGDMFCNAGLVPYRIPINIPEEIEDAVVETLGSDIYRIMDHRDELVLCEGMSLGSSLYNKNWGGFYYEVVDGNMNAKALEAMSSIITTINKLRSLSENYSIEPSEFENLMPRLFNGPPQKSDEWYRYRVLRITASKVASLMIDYKRDGFKTFMDSMLEDARKFCVFGSLPQTVPNAYMQHGLDWEASARRCLSDLMLRSGAIDIVQLSSEKASKYGFSPQTPILECGIVGHQVYDWLAASPDGITHDGILIEIKCPSNEAKVSNPDPRVIASYEMQIMTQMECTGMKFAILYVFFPIFDRSDCNNSISDNSEKIRYAMNTKPTHYKAFVKPYAYDKIKSINLIKALCPYAHKLKNGIATFNQERSRLEQAETEIENHLMEEN